MQAQRHLPHDMPYGMVCGTAKGKDRKEQMMSKEEAMRYWEWIYENIKDYFDPHWEGSERREHMDHVQAVEWAIKALKGADDE